MRPLDPIALVSVSILLSSCVLGPQPGSPELDLPGAIRSDSAPHGSSFGDKSWHKVFSDPDLRNLISRAIANNPDLVAATFRIEQARALEAVSRADWFPTIGAGTGATAHYASPNAGQVGPGGDRHSESYDITANLSWEIDLWGGIRRSNEAARSRLLQSQYLRDAVQTSLVASVASAYIELKNLEERLAISRRTADSRKSSLDLVTSRRDGGVSSDLEVGQADALVGQALTAIPITEKAIFEKENEIRALLGEYPGGIARKGSLDNLDSSLRINGGLSSGLMERRSDVAAANQAYQAAVAEIGVAEALRLPTLSLTGSGGLLSSDLNNLLEGKSGTYSIGPNLTGPIFDAGRNKARVDAAKARAGEAQAAHKSAAVQAFREAADAINAHVKTGEIVTQQTRLVNSYRNVASVSSERFSGGSSSYLEVLDAERSLFDAELELADARRDRLLSVVQAYRALGGGWK
ncbi:efflux transporter outer membrane subunit [Luteolibacter yonseiensis]|uniref:Efflux transporter outer membrane subunit n=1 Tax=Luteolibacter yonseiensis TaxID=1144680 RepID=A0A934R0N1_9BACT|nr:efflux transporter outer membrane subunit [Luteolibacter yonseiensis]MBK1814574.1 efflux transporter outer membrane subunit [Luteolibacter yonseiensis]